MMFAVYPPLENSITPRKSFDAWVQNIGAVIPVSALDLKRFYEFDQEHHKEGTA